MSEIQWFFIDGAGEKQGPHRMSEIQGYAIEGMINAESLLWHEGLEEWSPANHFPDVVPHLPVAAVTVAATQSTVQLQEAEPTQSNPYAAPLTNATSSLGLAPAPLGGEYPFPPVKRSSFGKYLGFVLGGIALMAIGFLFVFVAASVEANTPPPTLSVDGSQPPSSDSYSPTPQGPPPAAWAGMISIGLGYLFLIVGGIIGLIHLYRAWFILQTGGAQTTPGKAVGFLFIPFFSLYWVFVAYPGWAKDWTRIRQSYPNLRAAPPVNHGLFLTMPICLICSAIPFLGIFILPVVFIISIICQKQMCAVINFIASAHSQQQMRQGSGGLKLY